MEQSPLTAAHNLARNAYASTKDVSLASQQHRAAAEKFVEAGAGLHDTEALRILSLLGEHHQRLARTVEDIKDTQKSTGEQAKSSNPRSGASELAMGPDTVSTSKTPSTHPRRKQSPTAVRKLQREQSSTIASSLATARGIPSNQQRVSQQRAAQAHDITSDTPSRKRTNSPSLATDQRPENRSAAQQELKATLGKDPSSTTASPTTLTSERPNDDAFQRFYSTFEGLVSKISAPLAFTGLPLVSETQPDANSSDRTGQVAKSSNTPIDVDKHFSKAALRAASRDANQGPGVHDSFYVVPPGGGTVSYAGMLARERKHARHLSAASFHSDKGSGDRFVDAHETPPPSRSGLARRTSQYRSPSTNKTFEELEEENAWLKQLTDELSQKVYTFEKDSQSRRGEAMQQSMWLRQQQARGSAPKTEQNKDEIDGDRARALKEQVLTLKMQVEKRDKEIERQKGVINKYRERWQGLIKQAKGKRESGAPDGVEPVDEAGKEQ